MSDSPTTTPRLHVNCDHVATVRQARRAHHPDPVAWVDLAEEAGAQGITVHLRKDRRHIQDHDVLRLRQSIRTLLNLELSLDPGIIAFALNSGADEFCIVPENRQEVTTEGGLDVVAERARLSKTIPELQECKGLVSLFVDPEGAQLRAAADLGADFVELHTGTYANAAGAERQRELERLVSAAAVAQSAGLRVNAGHGLDYENVGPVAAIEGIEELNI
ncbi:MAG: pyridoxine 5'-phosphate synthase, partial [Planctomycetota bacterium]